MPRLFRAIAVQPHWNAQDFTSAPAFRRWMRGQMEMARPFLSAERPNLVVLTELNGLPLVLRGGGWALWLGTFQRVAAALVLARLPRVLPIMLRENVSAIRALQLADADANAQLYLHTCRDLAREYGVYLCCGSTPMPRYALAAGRPQRAPGLLTNQTVLLGPDGELIGVTDKVHLTPDEEAGGVDLSAGLLSELRVFPTPVGDLGVAISLDAFRADVIGRLEAQGCTVLLQPDANGAPWPSLEGLPPDPANVRDQPVAWLESSWTASTQGQHIRYAINPMVVGNLLDMTFDGQSAITGRPEDAPQLRSYALTEPRPGFIALADWPGEPETSALSRPPLPAAEIRQYGQHRAAGSGHALENSYHTTTLWADLSLPDQNLAPAPRLEHELALETILNGHCHTLSPTSAAVPAVLAGRILAGAIVAGLGLALMLVALRHKVSPPKPGAND